MSHIWFPQPRGGWTFLPLSGEAYELLVGSPGRLAARRAARTSGEGSRGGVRLLRSSRADGDIWALAASPECELSLNGLPVPAGLRVLRDRDEVRLAGGGRIFFSTERPAAIESYPEPLDGTQEGSCPRCKDKIDPGSPAVRCPGCGVWHHQSEMLPCWTYAERCFLCDQSTELDSGFRFVPEGI
jgi:hypothetical protein